MIGIYTQYHRVPAAYLAMQLGTALRSAGKDCELGSPHPREELDPVWDLRVRRVARRRFTHWANRYEKLIWTTPLTPDQSRWLRKRGKASIGVVGLDGLREEMFPAYEASSDVLCTSETAADYLEGYLPSQVLAVPWYPGTPVIDRDPPRDRLRAVLPLHGDRAQYVELELLERLLQLLRQPTTARLTVTYVPSQLRPGVRGLLRRAADELGGRLRLIRDPCPVVMPVCYSEHNLTICLSQCDPHGDAALTSVGVGTPILAADAPPFDEILTDTNGIPVPAELDCVAGTLRVHPNYRVAADFFAELAACPELLPRITSHDRELLRERRRCLRQVVGTLV